MWRRVLQVPTRRTLAHVRHHVPTPRQMTVDHELPDVMAVKRTNRFYFGAFCVTMAAAVLGMIKYEDANSPIVTSTMHALRRSPLSREAIGDNVRFCSPMPWIRGSAGIAKPVVDFGYWAEGDKGPAFVHFRAEKVPQEPRYVTVEWSLAPPGQPKIDLITEEYHPFVPSSNSEEPGVQRH